MENYGIDATGASSRVERLCNDLNASDLFFGTTGKPLVSEVEIVKDLGWSQLLRWNGSLYGQVRNTGWFVCDSVEEFERQTE